MTITIGDHGHDVYVEDKVLPGHSGILGISPGGDTIFGGYDDKIDTSLSPDEKRELALHMIDRWKTFGGITERQPGAPANVVVRHMATTVQQLAADFGGQIAVAIPGQPEAMTVHMCLLVSPEWVVLYGLEDAMAFASAALKGGG